MKRRVAIISPLLLILILLGVLSAGATLAQDPSDQQATIDAMVQQFFTQTAEAGGPTLTEQALAQTATAQVSDATAQANATANFQATLDTAFAAALTATASTGEAAATEPAADVETAGLEIVLTPVGEDVDEAQLEEVAEVVRRRLEGFGISGGQVEAEDDKRVVVRLPAVENEDALLQSLSQTGLLEFVDFSGMEDLSELPGAMVITTAGEALRDETNAERPDGALLNPATDEPFETVVTSADIESATASEGDFGWQVVFRFSEQAGQEMLEFSRAHIGEPLAIVLDGEVITVPVIQAEFGTTGGLISGNFAEEEAERLALFLNSGPFNIGMELASVEPIAFEAEVAAEPTATLTPTPSVTFTPSPSPTFDPRPTATVGTIQVAEEVFERGRMFYIQPTDQIWVMVVEGEGEGTWAVYDDTFEEGEAEFDPSLTPPEGLLQPERGFGKLWRENEEVRDALGWAVTPEFGYQSEYIYQPGGELVDGEFVPGPGYHVLFTLYGEAIRFNEGDNTWELNDGDDQNSVLG